MPTIIIEKSRINLSGPKTLPKSSTSKLLRIVQTKINTTARKLNQNAVHAGMYHRTTACARVKQRGIAPKHQNHIKENNWHDT